MTVVVGYVPTETGFSAVVEAERAARCREVAVVVVNVVGATGYRAPTAADQRHLDAVAEYLNKRGIRHSLRSISSDERPADVLLNVAQEVDASLILLGLHQRSWIARRVLGSTAQAVVLAAPCPVLVVPDVDETGDQPTTADTDAPPLRSMGQTPDFRGGKPR
ncbi:MAG TPA: universal stress protein [Jatrophihabitantaceae bacterium]|jgi:nucleotide-binding universal stress UspA family protein